eukprot:1935023-Pleurochrysis_carterae.AAC.1
MDIALLFCLSSASCKTECTARLWWAMHILNLVVQLPRGRNTPEMINYDFAEAEGVDDEMARVV